MSKLYVVYKADHFYIEAFSGWVCTVENFKNVVAKIIEDEGYYIEDGKLITVEKQPFLYNGLPKKDAFKLLITYEDLCGDVGQTTWIMDEVKTL